jgi:hypothetical protein
LEGEFEVQQQPHTVVEDIHPHIEVANQPQILAEEYVEMDHSTEPPEPNEPSYRMERAEDVEARILHNHEAADPLGLMLDNDFAEVPSEL